MRIDLRTCLRLVSTQENSPLDRIGQESFLCIKAAWELTDKGNFPVRSDPKENFPEWKPAFTWDRNEVKPEWKSKFSACLHETGTKSRNIPNPRNTCSVGSIFYPLPFLAFLLLFFTFVRMRFSAFRTGLKWSFVFTYMPIWIQPSLNSVGSVQQAEWLQTGLSYFRPGLMWTSIIYK